MIADRRKFYNAVFCILALILLAGCGKKTDTDLLVCLEVDIKRNGKRLQKLEDDIDSLRKSVRQLRMTLTELQTQQKLAARIEQTADTSSVVIPSGSPQETVSTICPSERQITEFSGSHQIHEIPFFSKDTLDYFQSVNKSA